MKSTKKKVEAIEGNDVCMLMHTALRKGCDSKITSSVYNMIHLLDVKPDKYNPWRLFGQLVADRLNRGEVPTAALKAAHIELEVKFLDLWCESGKRDEAPENARTWFYALWCAMDCFSPQDWEGTACFLGPDEQW